MPEDLNKIDGQAQGQADVLVGTKGDDLIHGKSGDDVLKGGRGEDRMIGGQGNDVLAGGMDADTFVWSAGHIGDGETDFITDFSLAQGDMLQFLDSGSGDLNVLSIEVTGSEETEANGVDLRNKMTSDNDVVFTIQNSTTGATQEIVVLDAWSLGKNDQWVDFLADLGLVFGDNTEDELPEYVEIDVDVPEFVFIPDDAMILPEDVFVLG